MRRILFNAAFALAFLATIPAKADDAALKKEIETLGASYMDCYSKKDPACIATHYTSDGIMVNPTGIQKPVEVYTPAFAAGFTKLDAKVVQAHSLGTDAAIATGTFHITGKDAKGADLDVSGKWTAGYVKEGGKLKIRMLTAVPNPPAK